MRPGSIRFRLWSAAAISIVVVLAVAGVGLAYLFERHVERRAEQDLLVDLNQLIGATTFVPGGGLTVAPILTDPRFNVPLSGRYWQVVDIATGAVLSSRSLWDTRLSPPQEGAVGTPRTYETEGPDGLLLAMERTIHEDSGRSFRAIVAEDHRAIGEAVNAYTMELAALLLLLAVVLIAANFAQITIGLAPLERLRAAVSNVAARRSSRLEGEAPGEVQPLADEINRLLDAQEKALVRARSRATDLAHGLKTPLQVLGADIRRLRERGESELAAEIEQSAGAIRRHVERELARARVAPTLSLPAASRVAEVAAGVVAVVQRTPQGERVAFRIEVPDELVAPIDEGDLTEILGNLVENAARYAASTVTVTASREADTTLVAVADDGPGIADADREVVLSRGVRLDAKGGSGLGLAIVSDIVEAYGGRIAMTDAAPGLRVAIRLPGSRT